MVTNRKTKATCCCVVVLLELFLVAFLLPIHHVDGNILSSPSALFEDRGGDDECYCANFSNSSSSLSSSCSTAGSSSNSNSSRPASNVTATNASSSKSNSKPTRRKTAVVIGAGPVGLLAALQLHELGVYDDVTVYDQRSAVRSRVQTVYLDQVLMDKLNQRYDRLAERLIAGEFHRDHDTHHSNTTHVAKACVVQRPVLYEYRPVCRPTAYLQRGNQVDKGLAVPIAVLERALQEAVWLRDITIHYRRSFAGFVSSARANDGGGPNRHHDDSRKVAVLYPMKKTQIDKDESSSSSSSSSSWMANEDNPILVPFDVLIGADGAKSKVKQAMGVDSFIVMEPLYGAYVMLLANNTKTPQQDPHNDHDTEFMNARRRQVLAMTRSGHLGNFASALRPFPVVDGRHMYYGLALKRDEYMADRTGRTGLWKMALQVYGLDAKRYDTIAAEATFEYKLQAVQTAAIRFGGSSAESSGDSKQTVALVGDASIEGSFLAGTGINTGSRTVGYLKYLLHHAEADHEDDDHHYARLGLDRFNYLSLGLSYLSLSFSCVLSPDGHCDAGLAQIARARNEACQALGQVKFGPRYGNCSVPFLE